MKSKGIIAITAAIIALIIGGALYYVHQEKSHISSDQESFAKAQRDLMEEELRSLSADYEEQYNKVSIRGGEGSFALATDLLMQQLAGERAKVDRLLEELRQVKTSSAAEIAKLSREVTTLRKVLRSYVVQIDSLHATNERLRAENQEVKASYERVSTEAKQLTTERNKLTERVNLAAKLDATAIRVIPMNKKGKPTNKLNKVETIQISFVVPKNVTASVGNKTFYARIIRPDDELLSKPGSGTFAFEGNQIGYSIQRTLEYGGEELAVTMYWSVEETLPAGLYRVQLFADGNLIGSSSFSL